MTLLADAIQPRRLPLWNFLSEELAPRPGRIAAATRIAGSCAVVVAIAMVFQIPLPAYMAYLVFLVSQSEAASTLLTGIVGALAVTLAVAVSLLFYTLDASEPALRLFLMASSTFVAMFLVRTLALGPVAFLMGYVLVLSQTVIDEIPNLESLTRLVLWLWVVVAVPAAWTVLTNLVAGENPTRLAHRTALRLLKAVAAALRDEPKGGSLERQRADAIALVELRHRAAMLDHALSARTASDTALIEILAEILILLEILPVDTPREARAPLAVACDAIILAFERGTAPASIEIIPPESELDALAPTARPVVVALAEALERLAAGIARRPRAVDPPKAPSAKAAFVPDAFTNPSHVRFALKTTVAVMASYITYSALAWPGISTCITTCFFVALGTLGETMHKLTLRLSGAVIGGIIGGLCIVYVLPAMTDIGQLCLLIIAVAFACAWVSTSSELLSYAGMQAAFAFFLGVLQGYGPSTDLTVLRDRVVGILLGNFLMSLVFSVVWPVSAPQSALSSLAKALRALAPLLTQDDGSKPGVRLAVVRALVEARKLASIAIFELRMLPKTTSVESSENLPFQSLERLAAAVFVAADQPSNTALAEVLKPEDSALSAWLLTAADRLKAGTTIADLPDPSSNLSQALAALAPVEIRAAVEARMLLRSEISHAFAK